MRYTWMETQFPHPILAFIVVVKNFSHHVHHFYGRCEGHCACWVILTFVQVADTKNMIKQPKYKFMRKKHKLKAICAWDVSIMRFMSQVLLVQLYMFKDTVQVKRYGSYIYWLLEGIMHQLILFDQSTVPYVQIRFYL